MKGRTWFEQSQELHRADDDHLFRSATARLKRDANRGNVAFSRPVRELSKVVRLNDPCFISFPPAKVTLADGDGVIVTYVLEHGRWFELREP